MIDAIQPTSRAAIGKSILFFHFLTIAVALLAAEAALLSSCARMFSTCPNLMVAHSLYLDGFGGPAQGRVAVGLWSSRDK